MTRRYAVSDLAYGQEPQDDHEAGHSIRFYLLGETPTPGESKRVEALLARGKWPSLKLALALRAAWGEVTLARVDRRLHAPRRSMLAQRDSAVERLEQPLQELIGACESPLLPPAFDRRKEIADTARKLWALIRGDSLFAQRAPAKRQRGRPGWRARGMKHLHAAGVGSSAARYMLTLLSRRRREHEERVRFPWTIGCL
jgi:hypothetical protein